MSVGNGYSALFVGVGCVHRYGKERSMAKPRVSHSEMIPVFDEQRVEDKFRMVH